MGILSLFRRRNQLGILFRYEEYFLCGHGYGLTQCLFSLYSSSALTQKQAFVDEHVTTLVCSAVVREHKQTQVPEVCFSRNI